MHIQVLPLILYACLTPLVAAIAATNVVNFKQVTDHIFQITTATTSSTISFLQPDVIRLQTTLKQTPAVETLSIVSNHPAFDTTPANEYDLQETQTQYLLIGPVFTVTITKKPFLVGVYTSNSKQSVFQELWPIDFDVVAGTTTQYTSQQKNGQTYGGGIQTNGYINQRNKTINVQYSNTSTSPAPLYFTTSNYGILRNTFSTGIYSFGNTLAAEHNETQYDAYILLDTTVSGTLLPLLNTYTKLTGRSHMPPISSFGVGDISCYSDPFNLTSSAAQYLRLDLPLQYIVAGDGCGSALSPSTTQNYLVVASTSLAETNLSVSIGLTQTFNESTSQNKTNIRLLDGQSASSSSAQTVLESCDAIEGAIESNIQQRAFIIGVQNGWAGIQRSATVRVSDQSTSWESIRTQIPAIQTAGISGFSLVSTELDIFSANSPDQFIRDLQWKVFTPIFYIRGIGKPWAYGEPYTSHARQYLKLRQSFIPYLYTLAYQAYTTGVPMVRPMSLEFPELQPLSLQTPTIQYQFMLGRALLVAPVYTNVTLRENIFLPNGTWFDFWSGAVYKGAKTLPAYHAALSQIPLFVRTPAILPQLSLPPVNPKAPSSYPSLLTDPLQLSIYIIRGQTHSYTLYSDDGKTQAYLATAPGRTDGVYSTQVVTVDYATAAHIYITINPLIFNDEVAYPSAPTSRKYTLILYTPDTVINSNVKYIKTNNGGVQFTLDNISSDQEAMVIVYLREKNDGTQVQGGGVHWVGASVVVVILLGVIILMVFFEKAKDQHDEMKKGKEVMAPNAAGGDIGAYQKLEEGQEDA
ncbi:hypothetical protein BCR33DRAFT_740861 [Rhizoclosmatium globosum]|uniref:Uncharacterized protein n=1 Tax=Rhizoclosmatium globosum TaxID=329046 RepID=A0A1Y2BXN1_9FUNG|nr:hypothetical protein BCR33DRAFT_740861 [Rhizoclosmatium globosum]|eukprot:ORY39530.1 hypothetical protein BCR33DRAFT_740861 [Rhizoclosmatium globosum]